MAFIISYDSCRICLKKSDSIKALLESWLGDMSYSDIFSYCTGFKMDHKTEFYPVSICGECEIQLLDAFAFKKKCSKSEKVLLNILSFYEDDIEVEKGSNQKIEIDQSMEEIETYEEEEHVEAETLAKEESPVKYEFLAEEDVQDEKNEEYYLDQSHEDTEEGEDENVIVEEYIISEPEIEMDEEQQTLSNNVKRSFKESDADNLLDSDDGEDNQQIMVIEEQGLQMDGQIAIIMGDEEEIEVQSVYSDPESQLQELNEEQENVEDKSEKTYRKFKDYKRDYKKTAGNESLKTVPEQCPECGKLIKRRYMKKHLDTHLRKQDQVKQFECDECESKFSLKENLLKHKRIHANEKRYECSYCGEKFLHWASRRYHITCKHTGEKRFSCEYCGAKFRQSSHFIVHMRRHTGDTPYSCVICEKKFNSGNNLKSHLTAHSNERNFSCETCSKTYKTMKALKTHFLTHNGEKNYVCPVCSKAFSQNHVLKTHMKVHPEHPLPPAGTIVNVKALERLAKANLEYAAS